MHSTHNTLCLPLSAFFVLSSSLLRSAYLLSSSLSYVLPHRLSSLSHILVRLSSSLLTWTTLSFGKFVCHLSRLFIYIWNFGFFLLGLFEWILFYCLFVFSNIFMVLSVWKSLVLKVSLLVLKVVAAKGIALVALILPQVNQFFIFFIISFL